MGLRKAQAMAPPVVLTMSKYMFIQKGAKDETKHDTQVCRRDVFAKISEGQKLSFKAGVKRVLKRLIV